MAGVTLTIWYDKRRKSFVARSMGCQLIMRGFSRVEGPGHSTDFLIPTEKALQLCKDLDSEGARLQWGKSS